MLFGATLDEIPFVFVNTKDIVPNPDEPPLAGLARLALAIYRGEADYRQNLSQQGQDTLVITGDLKKRKEDLNALADDSDEPLRVGAGSVIELEQGGTAEYVGISGDGISEQRTSLENDRKRADAKSGQLINAMGSEAESGEALKTRLGAQTATLKQIALTGAAALEWLLKTAARWKGADPEQVKVTPNLEFGRPTLLGRDLVELITYRSLGGPLSLESLHAITVDQGYTKLTFEEEKQKVDEERASEVPPPTGTAAGGNPPANRPPAE
jgi:hypothetical protein